ncbi:MAG: cytochrome c [Chitinophagaceae bacterium]|nr:cytochrome c [Chitinophagaceae bacterium]MDP1763461.1 c-type cytochrome [Sediminibacterium sp.]MDP1811899.1 c-type cytochrome [Sediminibacterium sp.]MDP3128464.1 c-type cytochrome [Sediminibacterium sp.]MDP3666271.1 c-type cytochrome [Sediminibacterium sp.]
MKKFISVCIILTVLYACGNQNGTVSNSSVTDENKTEGGNPSYDPNRGEGKFKSVEVSGKLDDVMAESGNKVYSVKCSSCHKTTEEKLVGPGWKGVTSKYSAPWIMNFITNTDEMITKDPRVQAQLEICLVRMPNQNLTDTDARQLYEFMRKNDGVK